MSILGWSIGPGISVGPGWSIGFPAPSFTMSPADITFTTVQGNTATYSSETSAGFTTNVNPIISGVQYSTTGTTASQISAVLGTLGNDPYAWTVSWTTGGTGVARITLDGSNLVTIAPIDTSFSNWQTTNINITPTLPGTYTFPATFTLYNPETDLNNGGTGWC